jgi:hypothetical protein
MKALVLGFVLATHMGSALAAKAAKKDLVLIGMVTGIDPLVEEFGVDHFMITVAVTKVVSGNLHEPTFKFPIHSVARSRLEFGGTYEIRARWKRGRYLVLEPDIRAIGTPLSAEPPSKDLLLVAKVTAIKTNEAGDLRWAWLVSTEVEKVLSGDWADRTFQFPIHSPAQAGLKVGKTYTIPARWTGDGYEVDELDVWRRNAH